MRTRRRFFVICTVLGLAFGIALARPTAAQTEIGVDSVELRNRPNILLILIDDLGWMDLHCQGNSNLTTPNIDQFARQGMRFTDAYAAAPVCSPTRAAILTGQSPARLQITNHLPDQARFTPDDSKLLPAAMRDHLPLEQVTIAERLREAGYATGFFGKWHLYCNQDTQFGPLAQGFDVNLGGCSFGGPPTYFDPYRIDFLPDRKPGEYLPDRLADETIQFMRSRHEQNQPFFAALFTYTVHWPMEAPEPLIEKYRARPMAGFRDPRYAAMIEAMDDAVGRVLQALNELGIDQNTLVVFTSDNGAFGGVSDLQPLRGCKGYLYEGGIRVPMIVRWPGKIAADTTSSIPVISTDLYSTFLDAAGLQADPRLPADGTSLWPLLSGTGSIKRDAMFWHYPNFAFHRDNRLGSAIRRGEYKLIEYFDDGSVELYNLIDDIGETQNLAIQKPLVAEQLRRQLVDWRRESNAALPRVRNDH